jgi:hypothetical protein
MSSRDGNKGGALSRSARSLVDAAREADTPTAADRERVKKALAVAIAASAVTASASAAGAAGTKAAIASSSGLATSGLATGGVAAGGVATGGVAGGTLVSAALGASLFTKVALVVVAVGVTSGAVVATQRLTSPAVTTESVMSESPATEPSPPPSHEVIAPAVAIEREEPTVEAPAAPIEVAPEVAPTVTAHASEETTRRPIARPTRREEPAVAQPVAPTAAESSIEAELALLPARGTPTEMLERISEYDRRFPHGQMRFARDRACTRAIRNLCAQGPEAVAAYLAANPGSPHASAIRTACP